MVASKRELPPPPDDYALGKLVAEVSGLVVADEKIGYRMDSLRARVNDLEESSTKMGTTVKIATGMLGFLAAALLTLGVWLVRTTLINEQRIEVLETNMRGLDEQLKITDKAVQSVREDMRELRVLEEESSKRTQEQLAELKQLLLQKRR